MKNFLQTIKGFFGLSFQLAKAGFKLRNEGSFLGIFWYLIGPLLTFALLLAVFSARLGNGIVDYPLYLLLGLVMFNFFQFVTVESTRAIYENRGVIKSIKFNLEAIAGSSVLKALCAHFFEIIVFGGVMVFFRVSPIGLVFYPIILFFFSVFVFGASLILSSLTVYFTDLENIWVFISRLLWFATPIFYDIGGQDRLYIVNLFNPLYYFISIARDLVVYGQWPALWLMEGAVMYSLIFLLAGGLIFNRLKRNFAERV